MTEQTPEQVPSTPLEPPQSVPSTPLKPATLTKDPHVVIYSKDEFLSRNPQFEGKLNDAQMEYCFELACLVVRNDAKSIVPYDVTRGIFTRKAILYLLMCHMCTLALRPYDQAGALQSATEGSVSASFAVPTNPDSTYFCQTPCGATFWQLFKQYARGGYYFAVSNYHPWG